MRAQITEAAIKEFANYDANVVRLSIRNLLNDRYREVGIELIVPEGVRVFDAMADHEWELPIGPSPHGTASSVIRGDEPPESSINGFQFTPPPQPATTASVMSDRTVRVFLPLLDATLDERTDPIIIIPPGTRPATPSRRRGAPGRRPRRCYRAEPSTSPSVQRC